ncbi:MAG: heavy metal translocating P-type ATPase, partial [Polyangiales bacterium]
QCAVVVEHSLDRMVGILEANVAYASERVVVEFDADITSPARIEARVEALGYTLETPEPGHVCSHHAHGGGLAPKIEIPLAIAGGVLTALGWATRFWTGAPTWLAIACYATAIASGGFFAARGAFNSLRQLRVDIESLMVLAALAAAVLGAWFEGAFLLFLFSLGHSIEHRAMDRARRAVEAISKLKPRTAQRMLSPVSTPDEVEEVPVEEVTKGDWIVVRPGDRVPMDGKIIQGDSSLEQAALTGESVPTPKSKGDEVYCGSINGDGVLVVEVLRAADDSILARMVDLVVQAEARQGPSQRLARKIEQRVVPLVLGGAILLPFILIALSLPLKEALLRTVALLVAASPCALAISTPAAVLSAVAAAARGGVLVKGGAYLEALAHVEAIAFDKTGTLTAGKPRVVAVEAFAGATEDELLATAAGLEVVSSHPLAKAIVDAARERALEPVVAEKCEAIRGKGLRAIVSGQPAELGSLALFDGTEIPEALRDTVLKLQKAGRTTVVVRLGERFLGALGIADTLRPESKEVLLSLKELGVVRLVMLSGDNALVANAVGAEVGIDHVEAPLMPQGKVDVVRKMSRTRKGVAMVGDGVNDAPALAAATVGVAMGGIGSDVALETADVVLMGDDLRRLPFAVALAQKTTSIIRQNLVISLGVAGVLVVASLFGIARVSESVIFHEGSTLLVVANGLRLLRFRRS